MSYFVININRKNSIQLAKEFGQKAVLFGKNGSVPEIVMVR